MKSITVSVINKLGLHARASSKLVMLANQFSSNITISKEHKSANAKSLMTVMMLAANNGSKLVITAEGTDKELAVTKLTELINNKFGEAE